MTSRPLHRPGDDQPRTQWPPPDLAEPEPVNVQPSPLANWVLLAGMTVTLGGVLGLLLRIVT